MPRPNLVKYSWTSLVVLANAFMLNSAALAQAPSTLPYGGISSLVPSDDPIVHYRAYEAAIARGDLEAASTAAVTAWQTGERVWNGNNPNLPGLAFNAAWSLGLANKIGEGRAAARRAVDLAALHPDKVNVNEAAFLLAYGELMATPTKATVERFNAATQRVDNGGWGDFLLAKSYVDGARAALNIANPRIARDMIDRGLVEIARSAPYNDVLRTSLFVLRTQSSLQLNVYMRAVSEVMEARRSYGPPKSARDVNWAALVAWEAASRAVYQSVYGSTVRTGTRISREETFTEWSPEANRALSATLPECRGFEFQRAGRGGPIGITFPGKEMNDGYAGGALVRASLDATGKVIATDILAALPRASFGTAAATGIQGWRYVLPDGVPAQCRVVDVTLVYAFGN